VFPYCHGFYLQAPYVGGHSVASIIPKTPIPFELTW